MSTKSRSLIAAAGAASAAIALAMTPAAAQAATPRLISCYAAGCTGYAAAQTYCVDDAEIIYSVNIIDSTTGTVVGNLQLKYSPSCRTTWARVVSGLGYGSEAEIISNSKANLWLTCNGSDGVGVGCNTDMIDDADMTSYASGDVYDAYGTDYHQNTGSY
jgi:hypothetical protein